MTPDLEPDTLADVLDDLARLAGELAAARDGLRQCAADLATHPAAAEQVSARAADLERIAGRLTDRLAQLRPGPATRGLLVEAAGRSYVLPLAGVERVVRVESPLEHVGTEPVLRHHGEVLPARSLAALLNHADTPAPERPRAVIAAINGRRIAVLVDGLVGVREVVVRPLGRLLRRVRGVAGATITRDGTVTPVLNLAELLAPPAA